MRNPSATSCTCRAASVNGWRSAARWSPRAARILADEPTGSLDPEMTDEVIHLLQHAAHQLGKCVIVVTHSKRVANSADVVLRLRSKKLTRA